MTRDISEVLETLDVADWHAAIGGNQSASATAALEDGKVLYMPKLAFEMYEHEKRFLDPATADGTAKNVAYNPKTGLAKHASGSDADIAAVTRMMRRYHEYARALVLNLMPHYAGALDDGRTSFRPVEIKGRQTSQRKDDTKLHVDAFPSSPVGDKRILRVFANVNPDGGTRHWRLGEPFAEVARQFAPCAPVQIPGSAWLMEKVGLTKATRTPYDHLMLNIHDAMKADPGYQKRAPQNEFHFPAGSTWIVYTDLVSHAAMAGQHLFEQTFYLPVNAMADAAKAPQSILAGIAAL